MEPLLLMGGPGMPGMLGTMDMGLASCEGSRDSRVGTWSSSAGTPRQSCSVNPDKSCNSSHPLFLLSPTWWPRCLCWNHPAQNTGKGQPLPLPLPLSLPYGGDERHQIPSGFMAQLPLCPLLSFLPQKREGKLEFGEFGDVFNPPRVEKPYKLGEKGRGCSCAHRPHSEPAFLCLRRSFWPLLPQNPKDTAGNQELQSSEHTQRSAEPAVPLPHGKLRVGVCRGAGR